MQVIDLATLSHESAKKQEAHSKVFNPREFNQRPSAEVWTEWTVPQGMMCNLGTSKRKMIALCPDLREQREGRVSPDPKK